MIKTKEKIIGIASIMALVVAFTLSFTAPQNVTAAPGGDKQYVQTTCITHSCNDCYSGSKNCSDNTCTDCAPAETVSFQ